MFSKIFLASVLACVAVTAFAVPLQDGQEDTDFSSSKEDTAADIESKFFFSFLANLFNKPPNPIWIPLPQLPTLAPPPTAPPAPTPPAPTPPPVDPPADDDAEPEPEPEDPEEPEEPEEEPEEE